MVVLHLLAVILLGGASRIVVDASAAAPPPPTAEVVVDNHDKRRRRLRAPLDNRTISFACFVSIVADYDDDYDGEGNDGEVPGIDDDRRTSTHPVVWVAYAVVLLYSVLYYFLMDRLGLHFYPIFNPRTAFSLVSIAGVLGLYSFLFLKWNEYIGL
jgi:hypothetical protein